MTVAPMRVYALHNGWVQREIDGIQINGKNYSVADILRLETRLEAEKAETARLLNAYTLAHSQASENGVRLLLAEDKIENAAQAMAETHSSWEACCHAIMAALGRDFGGLPPVTESAKALIVETACGAVEDYCSDMPDLAGHGHSVGLTDAIRSAVGEAR